MNDNFYYPTIPTLKISQRWGNVNAKMYPAPTYRHMGVDIGGYVGAPIYAATAGVVDVVNTTGAHGYGRHIIVRHLNFRTLYAHLHTVEVAAGDPIQPGQQIGTMGGQPGDDDPIDGASTGSHLHFEVVLPEPPGGGLDYIKTWLGFSVDPLQYLTMLAYGNPLIEGMVLARTGLRIRSEPSTNGEIIGALSYRDNISAISEHKDASGNVWLRLWSLRKEYVAASFNGETLVRYGKLQPEQQPELEDLKKRIHNETIDKIVQAILALKT